MSGTENDLERRTLNAAADLSTKQYHWVTIDSNGQAALAAEGSNAFGILQDKPAVAGRGCRVGYGGTSRALAGGSFAAGAKVTCNSLGKTVGVGSGDDYQLGIALEAGVDGRIISVAIDKRGLA